MSNVHYFVQKNVQNHFQQFHFMNIQYKWQWWMLATSDVFKVSYMLVACFFLWKSKKNERVSAYCRWHSNQWMTPPMVNKHDESMKCRTWKEGKARPMRFGDKSIFNYNYLYCNILFGGRRLPAVSSSSSLCVYVCMCVCVWFWPIIHQIEVV